MSQRDPQSPVARPEQVHSRQSSQEAADDIRESYETERAPSSGHRASHTHSPRHDRNGSTELQAFPRLSHEEASHAPDWGPSKPRLRRVVTSASETSGTAFRRFWRRQVHLSVPHKDCRDHLALERTYLSYLRTSLTLAQAGVTIAQLFRLQGQHPDLQLDFYRLGRPLAALLIVAGIVICLSGAWRFWRQQNALVRGKIVASGWEMHVVAWTIVAMMIVLFGVILGVHIPAAEVTK